MSDRNDTLLPELLDLARCQRAALNEGRLDDALSFLGKRKDIISRMQVIGRLTENQKMVIGDILSIDAEISTAVRRGMSDIASRLDGIEKLRVYFRSLPSASDGKQEGVTI